MADRRGGAHARVMTTDQPPASGPGGATAPAVPRTLLRCTHDRMIGGVCAGLAEVLGVDVTIVRVVAIILAVAGGLAVPAYLAAWLLIPDEDTNTSIAEQLLGWERRW
jgi:phage shock protein C